MLIQIVTNILYALVNCKLLNLCCLIEQNATIKLPADKEATRQDAEGVVSAELRNNPNVATRPGGVAASVAAAARLNQGNNT